MPADSASPGLRVPLLLGSLFVCGSASEQTHKGLLSTRRQRRHEMPVILGKYYGMPCVLFTSSSTLSAMTCSTAAVNGRGWP